MSGMVGSCIYTALQPFLLFCRIVLFVFSSFCIGKWSDLKLQELLIVSISGVMDHGFSFKQNTHCCYVMQPHLP